MIEIEKKFQLSADEQARLLKGAKLQFDATLTDTYYETSDYRLVKSDWWLRNRDGAFQLKIPIESSASMSTTANMYHELEAEAEIRNALELPNQGSTLSDDLAAAGFLPFVEAHSQRQSYEKDGFHIDVDNVTYAGSEARYMLAEVELLIEDESEAPEAVRRIDEYVSSYHIAVNQPTDGKIIAYIRSFLPEHFKAFESRIPSSTLR